MFTVLVKSFTVPVISCLQHSSYTNNPDSIPLLYYSLLCFNNRLISSVRGYLLTTENCFGLGFLAVDATRPLERALNMKCARLYVLVCTTCLALSKGMKG